MGLAQGSLGSKSRRLIRGHSRTLAQPRAIRLVRSRRKRVGALRRPCPRVAQQLVRVLTGQRHAAACEVAAVYAVHARGDLLHGERPIWEVIERSLHSDEAIALASSRNTRAGD